MREKLDVTTGPKPVRSTPQRAVIAEDANVNGLAAFPVVASGRSDFVT